MRVCVGPGIGWLNFAGRRPFPLEDGEDTISRLCTIGDRLTNLLRNHSAEAIRQVSVCALRRRPCGSVAKHDLHGAFIPSEDWWGIFLIEPCVPQSKGRSLVVCRACLHVRVPCPIAEATQFIDLAECREVSAPAAEPRKRNVSTLGQICLGTGRNVSGLHNADLEALHSSFFSRSRGSKRSSPLNILELLFSYPVRENPTNVRTGLSTETTRRRVRCTATHQQTQHELAL